MNSPIDNSTRELGNARLKLRDDIVFSPQTSGDKPFYLVEDSLNSRFFRIGQLEYAFVSLLDGDTSIQEAYSHLSNVVPDHNLTNADAVSLCRWLVEMDIAHTADSSDAKHLASKAFKQQRSKLASYWNPLMFRVPLGRPDAWLDKLQKPLGWLFSPVAMCVSSLLLIVGCYVVLADWTRFNAASQSVFEPHNWIWLLICWVVLKIIHECAHGLVCHRYGGTVRETGLLFIFFAPLAYVDVTSSWRFRSRRQRIHVAAAGMYIELLIASLAAIVWCLTTNDWVSSLCFNIIAMAGATTILFNANPLMKLTDTSSCPICSLYRIYH